jgi:hypothetical protein
MSSNLFLHSFHIAVEEPKAAAAAPPSRAGGFQLPTEDTFDKWIEHDDNVKKLEEILNDDKKFEQYFGKQS